MLKNLDEILKKLKLATSTVKKNQILDDEPKISHYINSHPFLQKIIKDASPLDEYIIKSLIAISQANNIFFNFEKTPNSSKLLKNLLEDLKKIDKFYESIGGIIGYHLAFLKLLNPKSKSNINTSLLKTPYIDITKPNKTTKELIDIGLKNLDKFAFILPMGGAGDRLNLFETKTKKPLAAATLNFQGRTLLENLIRDIEGLEYLYFKTFNKKILLPIVIMTSDEKTNHMQILEIFEEMNYFNRDKKSFHFIKQLSVPLITENGSWALKAPLKLALKPSGHGAIWQLLETQKGFDFLKKFNIKKVFIRQINNPIAGLDYLPLAFMGAAFHDNKAFGFVSCKIKKGLKEGINVLKEIKQKNGYLYNISNIEYTDFHKYFKDLSSSEIFSNFLANTNILIADLKEAKKACLKEPLPGLTINLKTKVFSKNQQGKPIELKAGRLESMMQNISDSIQDFRDEKIKKADVLNLKTFLILADRKKTISTTKVAHIEGKPAFETPEHCYYDVLSNYLDLLKNHCNIKMPKMPTFDEYLLRGPSFICDINPMLGPLYSIISKKIKGGQIVFGSEIKLEIAEVLIENLYLNGSLLIETNLIKKSNKNFYNSARCILNNVTVKNLGIDKTVNNNFLQNKIKRKEYLKIILGDSSEFYANNVEFINTHEIIVPSFHKMFILQENNKIIYKVEKI
ncbi:MAG: putative uridylyltransferase [Candidatus Anoxychlamydiales bacterium]|nr:putative uridylyltransferase [Candidatus Anoxychlamydiales bacterium]